MSEEERLIEGVISIVVSIFVLIIFFNALLPLSPILQQLVQGVISSVLFGIGFGAIVVIFYIIARIFMGRNEGAF